MRFHPGLPARYLLTALLLTLPAVPPARAQAPRTTLAAGTVTGRVTTLDGEPLAFASVVILDASLRAMTDAEGRFEIRDVPPGTYVVGISCLGYAKIEQEVEVTEKSAVRLNARLREQPMPTTKSRTAPFARSPEPEKLARFEAAAAEAGGIPFALLDGNLAFALALYRELADEEEGNLCISPLSVSTVLCMTYAGARGATATGMGRALHLYLPPRDLHPAFGTLLHYLDALGDLGAVELSAANRLWIQEGLPLEAPFLEINRERYGAGPEAVPFASDPEGARRRINAWVAKRTRERIEEILPPDAIDPRTTIVLTGALHLQAPWKEPFSPERTESGPFSLLPRPGNPAATLRTVPVPMMHRTGTLRLTEPPGLQVLEIPYRSDLLSMIVLLPRDPDGLPAVEEHLSPDSLRTWLAGAEPTWVSVTFPRFSFRTAPRLSAPLQRLGMEQAFREDADFSGITSAPLSLGEVFHQTTIDVREEGTEAAAAAAVAAARSLHPDPVPFTADHPFLFLIRDSATGTILFLGRVTNPAP